MRGYKSGRPLFVRLNEALSVMAGHPDYPLQIGVAISLKEMDLGGLPKNLEEQTEVDALEDAVAAEMARRNAVFAAAITGDGVREFVFYSPAGVEAGVIDGVIEGLVAEKGYHAQMIVSLDPHWRVYRKLGGRGCLWPRG